MQNRDVLISLYNKYWEGMCNGEKDWEVRKNHPGTTSFTAYIYETRSNGGSGKIVGKIEVDFIVEFATPIDLINQKTMLSLEELYEYAGGKALYGWHISNVEKFKKPLPLSEFGLERAPQSWQYIKGEDVKNGMPVFIGI